MRRRVAFCCARCRWWQISGDPGTLPKEDTVGRCKYPLALPAWVKERVGQGITWGSDGGDCVTFASSEPDRSERAKKQKEAPF